ncbi:MAG: triose-phosphate isomerase [Burkholderiales bacterium]|nr:MAG: triose-phosphate isomerase [Burkholderiales bacterium]
MRRKLVVGNWKMFGSLEGNRTLLEGVRAGIGEVKAEVAVCVPFPFLAQAQELLKGTRIQLGAQNVSEHFPGAFTGEVAACMLREFGCKYAIIGHSERRHGLHESSKTVAAKCAAVEASDMVPIVCVGETLAEREKGATADVVMGQLDAILSRPDIDLAEAVIAYEPVWAIGTGKTASPQQAQEVHALIRGRLAEKLRNNVSILYGGSVKPSNAAELFAMPDIDGGLIGGASLKASDFLAICAAA